MGARPHPERSYEDGQPCPATGSRFAAGARVFVARAGGPDVALCESVIDALAVASSPLGRSRRCRCPFFWSETKRFFCCRFLDIDLFGKAQNGNGPTGLRAQAQGFTILHGEYTNGFCVLDVGRRGAC